MQFESLIILYIYNIYLKYWLYVSYVILPKRALPFTTSPLTPRVFLYNAQFIQGESLNLNFYSYACARVCVCMRAWHHSEDHPHPLPHSQRVLKKYAAIFLNRRVSTFSPEGLFSICWSSWKVNRQGFLTKELRSREWGKSARSPDNNPDKVSPYMWKRQQIDISVNILCAIVRHGSCILYPIHRDWQSTKGMR